MGSILGRDQPSIRASRKRRSLCVILPTNQHTDNTNRTWRGFFGLLFWRLHASYPCWLSALWLAGVASVWHSWPFCISPLQTFFTQNIWPCQKCSSLNYWLFPQCFISWRGNSDAESAVTQHDWRYRCSSVPQPSVVCFTLLSACCIKSHGLCTDVNVCSCVCDAVLSCMLRLHESMWSVSMMLKLDAEFFMQTSFTALLKFQKMFFGWVLFCRNKILLFTVCTT